MTQSRLPAEHEKEWPKDDNKNGRQRASNVEPLTPMLDTLHGNFQTARLEHDQQREQTILTIRMNLMERLDNYFELPSPIGMTTSTRWPGVVFQGRDPDDRRINLSLINSEGMSSALREAWKHENDILKIR